MSQVHQSSRYSPVLIGLHWLMLLLLIGVYGAMLISDTLPKGSDARAFLKSLHFMLGISVLLLVVVRLAVRLSSPAPAIVPAPKAWEVFLARIMHLSLYAFMFFMPIAGWLILSANGHGVPFYGLELPALIATNKPFGREIHEWHETVGNIGYFLIGIHALAGLFHHYVRRDNTLRRMSLLKSK